MKGFTNAKRRIVLALAVLAALAVGVSQGLARAHADGTATAPIQYHNGNCGNDTGKRFIGTAKFTLKSGILTVSIEIHGADPGNYHLQVYQYVNGSCGNSWNLGNFKVDSSGEAAKSGSVNVSGSGRSFFADPSGAGHANDSLPVNL